MGVDHSLVNYTAGHAVITGGNFSSDVSSYCAVGYYTAKGDGSYYTLKPLTADNAAVSVTTAEGATAYYGGIQNAIDAADGGAAVKLLKDVSLATLVEISGDKNFTGLKRQNTAKQRCRCGDDLYNFDSSLPLWTAAQAAPERRGKYKRKRICDK